MFSSLPRSPGREGFPDVADLGAARCPRRAPRAAGGAGSHGRRGGDQGARPDSDLRGRQRDPAQADGHKGDGLRRRADAAAAAGAEGEAGMRRCRLSRRDRRCAGRDQAGDGDSLPAGGHLRLRAAPGRFHAGSGGSPELAEAQGPARRRALRLRRSGRGRDLPRGAARDPESRRGHPRRQSPGGALARPLPGPVDGAAAAVGVALGGYFGPVQSFQSAKSNRTPESSAQASSLATQANVWGDVAIVTSVVAAGATVGGIIAW